MTWTSVATWWESQAWGSVPEWVAAIGTVGALVWALVIFARDKSATDRLPADSFLTSAATIQRSDGRKDWRPYYEVEGLNNGTGPITDCHVHFISESPEGRKLSRHNLYIDRDQKTLKTQGVGQFIQIRPTETARLHVNVTNDTTILESYVSFTDYRGKRWARNIKTHKYVNPKALVKKGLS